MRDLFLIRENINGLEFDVLGLRRDAQAALDYVTRDERLSKLPIVRPALPSSTYQNTRNP